MRSIMSSCFLTDGRKAFAITPKLPRKRGSGVEYITPKKVPPTTIRVEAVCKYGPMPPLATIDPAIKAWVDLAPAMGMIGTLIGLVAMLGNMADPKAIGPAMATALLTTLYGAFLANILFQPMFNKLEGYTAYEVVYREMVVDGLRQIARGESPRNIQDKMLANLPPKVQEKMMEAA